MKATSIILIAFLTVGMLSNVCFAEEEKDSGKIHGYAIPEYYYVASHHTDGLEEGDIKGQHGFWFRRVYFGYDREFGTFKFRLRFEGNSPAYGEGTANAYVKDLWLNAKLGGGHNLKFGVFEPPSFDKIEKFWGYRHIEKTVLDLFKLASSRDTGAAIYGGKKFIYMAMVGNFGSNKGEDNSGKGFFGRLGYTAKDLYVEANGYYADDGSKDYMLLQGFAGLKGKWGNLALNYAYKNQMEEDKEDQSTSVMSAFGHLNISKKGALVLRYDHFFDVNLKEVGGYLPMASTIAPARLVIVALDFKIHKWINVGPNIKYVFYGDPIEGMEKPGNDFYINLTAKIKFESKL